jgi:hypothetical protein
MKRQNGRTDAFQVMLAAAALFGVMACGGDDSNPGSKPDWEGTTCGGFSGQVCPESVAYCDFPDNFQCGATDGPGVCRPRPDSCTKDCPGVCGCDSKSYCNACEAHRGGVDDVPDTTCMQIR